MKTSEGASLRVLATSLPRALRMLAVGTLVQSGLALALLAGRYPTGWLALGIGSSLTAVVLALLEHVPASAPTNASAARRIGTPLAVVIAVLFATASAAVGGAAGPLSPLLFCVAVAGAARGGPRKLLAASVATTILILVVTTVAPAAWTAPAVASPAREILWATCAATVLVSLAYQVSTLQRAYAKAARSLEALREDLLADNEIRARELESIGARVAHEIKNPLTSIKSLIALEREEAMTDRSRKRLTVIEGEVQRIQVIVHDYLSYARPLDKLRVREVDLHDLAVRTTEVLEARSRTAGLSLSVAGSKAVVQADPHRIRGALLNLISNAIEATPDGGAVSVEVGAHAEGGAFLTVRDTGKGMTPEQLARLGTPFFTTRDGGTGLGVVMARATIQQHGGTIDFESEPGRGTTVHLRLLRRAKLGSDPTASFDELVHPELADIVAASKAEGD
jgi:signal transduction histidine kinase